MNYWAGGVVPPILDMSCPSILDMSCPAIGSTGGGVGAGAGRAGRGVEVFGADGTRVTGAGAAAAGGGVGSGIVEGAGATGATVAAAGTASTSTAWGSAAGWQAAKVTAAAAERIRILMCRLGARGEGSASIVGDAEIGVIQLAAPEDERGIHIRVRMRALHPLLRGGD